MVKKQIPKQVIKKIDEYVKILEDDRLPIQAVFLYGSYAKGMQRKWSDIDLCIVSKKFTDPFMALQYLSLKTNNNIRYAIEPIGFHPNDMKDPYSPLIAEIRKYGVRIR